MWGRRRRGQKGADETQEVLSRRHRQAPRLTADAFTREAGAAFPYRQDIARRRWRLQITPPAEVAGRRAGGRAGGLCPLLVSVWKLVCTTTITNFQRPCQHDSEAQVTAGRRPSGRSPSAARARINTFCMNTNTNRSPSLSASVKCTADFDGLRKNLKSAKIRIFEISRPACPAGRPGRRRGLGWWSNQLRDSPSALRPSRSNVGQTSKQSTAPAHAPQQRPGESCTGQGSVRCVPCRVLLARDAFRRRRRRQPL